MRMADYPPEEIVTHYTMGHCHHMALALARRTGLPLAIMWNGLDWHVEPDENGDGGVKEVVHVYVDCGDGTVLDVKGRRSLQAMKEDFAYYDHSICDCEPLSDERLMSLIHDSRNLVPVDEGDVAEALEVVDALPELREAVADYEASAPAP